MNIIAQTRILKQRNRSFLYSIGHIIPQPRSETDIIRDVQPRQQQIFLRHPSCPSLTAAAVSEPNFSGNSPAKGSGNQSEQCRLSASTGSDETRPLAACYEKIQCMKNLCAGIGKRNLFQSDARGSGMRVGLSIDFGAVRHYTPLRFEKNPD